MAETIKGIGRRKIITGNDNIGAKNENAREARFKESNGQYDDTG